MTNQPATEALLACIRDVAGCTTGWSTYRPDRIAWLLTTRHPPSRRIRPECNATVHYTQKARGKLTTNEMQTNDEQPKCYRTKKEAMTPYYKNKKNKQHPIIQAII